MPLHSTKTGLTAHDYVNHGYPIFPLSGKRPFEGGGFHTATTDAEQIELWQLQYPGSNWGMPTGLASGFDVLDVDGLEGLASLAALEAEHGQMPVTPLQITGSGGCHYLFEADGNIGNSAGKLGAGLDVRGSGGYIVIAPSIHPEALEPYRWAEGKSIFELEPAPMPVWLRERIQARKRSHVEPGQRIPHGVQEATLMTMAGTMRRQGATESEILAALRVISAERCDPPVAEADLARMAASVCRYDPADPLITFAKSDAGNAERFAHVNGGRALYCAQLKKWLIWDGKRWEPDDKHAIDQLAIKAIRLTGERAMQMPSGPDVTREQREAREDMVRWALASESERRLSSMVQLARGLLAVVPKALDADPYKLCVENGVIDLRTGELLPHDPADLITKIAPVTYDPAATLPEWERFLEQTLGDKAGLIGFLQEAMGYSLTGLTSEEKLFFVYGPAGSGKSTFVEAFKAMLGDYAKTADFSAFIKHQSSGGPRNDIARLNGARYVTSIEVDQGKELAEGLIKTISGSDTVAARFLFSESVEFKPSLKLWLVANDAPAVNHDDSGMWRRILRVPFSNVVPEDQRDPRIKSLLSDPEQGGPALLAWAVAGALKWQERGKLHVPEVVREETDRYRAEQDGLTQFLEEACLIEPERQAKSAALFDAYDAHWQAYGKFRKAQRLTKDAFTKALANRGFESGRIYVDGKQVRGWRGISLKPADWSDDESQDT